MSLKVTWSACDQGEGRGPVTEDNWVIAATASRSVVQRRRSGRPQAVPGGRRRSPSTDVRAVSRVRQCPHVERPAIPPDPRTSWTAADRKHAQLQ